MSDLQTKFDQFGDLDNLVDELDFDYSLNEVRIGDMEQFRHYLLEPYRDSGTRVFYRGERISSVKRPLLPTMFRDRWALIPEGGYYVDIDSEYILNYYRSYGYYLKLFCSTFGQARKYCLYDLCAFSQHYLQRSPLIDFSKSLHAALSFGLKGKGEFEDDAILYAVEISDEANYTTDRVTAECWLDAYHVRVYDFSDQPEKIRQIPRTSPQAKIIDIATNDRMRFQQGVFLLLDRFHLVNHLYLTKNVRESIRINKYILDRAFCPELTKLVDKEAPWYSFANLLDLSAGIQTAIDFRRDNP